ncbi:hypothetical protein LTS12_028557, partial [Elasticomyces elasticus]
DEYPNLDEVDAIVMTGSKHNSFEDRPWINRLVEYTKKAIAHDHVKVLGICFGHQIIGRAFSVKVGRSELGWEISVSEVDLTEQGKKLFGKDKLVRRLQVFYASRKDLDVNDLQRIQQMHQDIVFECPSNVIPLGSSPLCAVQGMYVPGKFISVQGHPEYSEFIVSEIIKVRTKTGLFTGEQSADALRRVGNEHDGVEIGKVFLNFLLDEKA